MRVHPIKEKKLQTLIHSTNSINAYGCWPRCWTRKGVQDNIPTPTGATLGCDSANSMQEKKLWKKVISASEICCGHTKMNNVMDSSGGHAPYTVVRGDTLWKEWRADQLGSIPCRKNCKLEMSEQQKRKASFSVARRVREGKMGRLVQAM